MFRLCIISLVSFQEAARNNALIESEWDWQEVPWDSKPRITVLARASNNIALSHSLRLTKRYPKDRGGGPTSKTCKFLWENKNLGCRSRRVLKQRMTVLASASSSLIERPKCIDFASYRNNVWWPHQWNFSYEEWNIYKIHRGTFNSLSLWS
jgi:hypothetical protein